MSPLGDIGNQIFFGSITRSFFFFIYYFIEVTPPKPAKIIGVCEIIFFSKMNLWPFFDPVNFVYFFRSLWFCGFKKWFKIHFREKVYFTDPYYICLFWGGHYYKIFHFNKIWPSYGPKKILLSISPKGLARTFWNLWW